MSNEISFYVDCLIIEALAKNSMVKQADGGMIASLVDKLKSYVGAHLDSNNKVGSVLNILAPGAVTLLFRSLGFGWLGALLGLAMNIFHIDIGGILGSIYNSVKGMLGSGQPVTSTQIDSAAQGAVQDHAKPVTQEEAEELSKKMQTTSFEEIMQHARFVKLSMLQYEQGKISKTAGLLDALNSRKAKTSSILARVISLIFKVVLASAGLMVAGDIANKLVGRPNALDGTLQGGQPVAAAPPPPMSKQTKFPVKKTYRVENYNVGDTPWIERISNSIQSIGDMLVNFAKEVYDGLDGKESIIRQTAGYQAIQDKISWHNRTAEGGPLVYIPPMFRSKKEIVDYFIDDVAEKSP